MLQRRIPEDFVIATGRSHSVREFVTLAFQRVGLDWRKYVVIDSNLFPPAEVYQLRGDASRASKKLGWAPDVSFRQLVAEMVDGDMDQMRKGRRI